MNKFLTGLGVPGSWVIHDVYGLDDEILSMVPKPVGSVILLYPFTDKGEEFKNKQEEELEAAGQEVSEKVYFMKQFVGNACGTVALIHAIANNQDKIDLDGGALKDFLDKTASMNPEDRGHALESDEGISKAHEESAQEGQTEAPDRETELNEHFVTFVEVDGTLYELDGRRKFPINHGSTSADTLLQDAAKVCRQFMDRDPEESRFAIVALTGTE
ncbi:ubiquitin carboxyl-terminal hydrolase isozyme L3 isoform X2 [Panulirus ornatus]|uniref:ubiquitin carboxyl-terminal hydrolase isozyme L3 isoform X2 n=1 Tax=Panulirus ornatus TaxID=150431 RepID=UPI003A8A5859